MSGSSPSVAKTTSTPFQSLLIKTFPLGLSGIFTNITQAIKRRSENGAENFNCTHNTSLTSLNRYYRMNSVHMSEVEGIV
jgi:hypothetical protein